MEQFADMAKARQSYAVFAAAMEKGRDILQRAGIASAPPPVPEFDPVFRRLNPELRQLLFEELRRVETVSPPEAIRIWQPILKRAFTSAPSAPLREGGPGQPRP